MKIRTVPASPNKNTKAVATFQHLSRGSYRRRIKNCCCSGATGIWQYAAHKSTGEACNLRYWKAVCQQQNEEFWQSKPLTKSKWCVSLHLTKSKWCVSFHVPSSPGYGSGRHTGKRGSDNHFPLSIFSSSQILFFQSHVEYCFSLVAWRYTPRARL